MTRTRRTRATILLVVAILAAGATGWAISRATASAASSSAPLVPTSTAAVVRTDLSTTTQVAGTLGYAGSFPVVNQRRGTFTVLPALGQVVTQGQALYEVDGTGVPLFYGSRPLWRAIGAGMTAGPDVDELDQNLIALGYTDNGLLTEGNTFTDATTLAIDEWQSAEGVPVTGVLNVGDVVFAPGALRVASLAVTTGQSAQPGSVILSASSTDRSVDVALPVVQEYLVKVGNPVTITLPNGTSTTPGVIAAIAPVATSAPNSSGNGGPGNGGSGGSQATVDVTVGLTNPSAAGSFDQAPVVVNIVDASVKDVLAVPINALVAVLGGGYGVEIANGTQLKLVGVHTGLFANTLVQVTSSDLRAGMRVEVPKT
jgi:hypothetical protein